MTKLIAIYLLGIIMGTLLGLIIAFVIWTLHKQKGVSTEENYIKSIKDNSELLIKFNKRISEYNK